jgi:hypothetical protein
LTFTGEHIAGTPDEIRPARKTIFALRERVRKLHAAAADDAAKNNAEKAARREAWRNIPDEEKTYFQRVNDAALDNITAWAPKLFPEGKAQATGAWRVSSKTLGRNLQEDLSIHPDGIQDFGREVPRTPIDLVKEYRGQNDDAVSAARWLCDCLGVTPDSIGWGLTPRPVQDGDWPTPIDLWASFTPPELPKGLLPELIEKFARIEGAMMGADPAGLAMAALTICAAAIPDHVKLQPKKHVDFWTESARLWTYFIGDPSTKKTPIMNQAAWPIKRVDKRFYDTHARERMAYDALPSDERKSREPPKQKCARIEDISIEGAQEILKNNPEGVLCLQDELSGFFGMMDRYTGNHSSASKDRSFWLQAYNGGQYRLDRVSRGSVLIENLSMSLLGGIQPDLIRKLAADTVDDGLLQRGFPIILRPAKMGRDEPADPINSTYGKLVAALFETKPPRPENNFLPSTNLRFDDGAQAIRNELEKKHLDLQKLEAVNKKLAAHIGKYDGLFARLCIVWHCVENATAHLVDDDVPPPPIVVTEDTARRVARFMHEFLLPHAIAFYAGVLTLSDDHDQLVAVVGYILAHKLERITNRDVQRGVRSMRNMKKWDTDKLFEQLDAFGWVLPEKNKGGWAIGWLVNPEVHRLFQARAEREASRRLEVREAIAKALNP